MSTLGSDRGELEGFMGGRPGGRRGAGGVKKIRGSVAVRVRKATVIQSVSMVVRLTRRSGAK
jgi:hypothetical protein